MAHLYRRYVSPPHLHTVEDAPRAGKGVFAKCDVPLTAVIFEVGNPLVATLDIPRLKDTCYCCHTWNEKIYRGKYTDFAANSNTASDQEARELLVCEGCSVVRFCDKSCQKTAWQKYHKHECNIFSSLLPRILPNNVRAILRVLLYRKNGQMPSELWNQVTALEGHVDHLRDAGGERWDSLRLMAKATKQYSNTRESEQTVLELFCRLIINSTTLTTSTRDPIGLAMDPLVARVNHSCKYNATIRCDGGTIDLVPLRSIAKNEEITVSYIDATMPFRRRQDELYKRYFFKCHCSLCEEDIHGKPDQFISPSLGKLFDYDQVLKVEQQAIELLDAASNDDSISGPIQKLRYGMHLLANTDLWPVHRYPYSELRQQLVRAYLGAHQFHLAFVHAAILYLRIDPAIRVKHHPQRMVHAWIMVRLINHIIDRVEWATQKSEIHSLGLKLHWLRWDALKFLKKEKDKVYRYTIFHTMIECTHGRNQGNYHSHKEEQTKAEWTKVEGMIDGILEAEKTWNIQR